MSSLISLLFLLIILSFIDKAFIYYDMKKNCKKYNLDCNSCNYFLCPRYKVFYQEYDIEFFNRIKRKLKKYNIFNKKK